MWYAPDILEIFHYNQHIIWLLNYIFIWSQNAASIPYFTRTKKQQMSANLILIYTAIMTFDCLKYVWYF